MHKVTVDPVAVQDIAIAAKFYSTERPGLGDIFRKHVKAAFKKIAKQPELYVYVVKPYRGYFMEKFPFTVYYRESEEAVRILAVVHQHRHPDFWKDHLKR